MWNLKKRMHEKIKGLLFKYTRLMDPKYLYLVEPIQLAFLVNFLESIKNNGGSILEVGVDKGMTTRFLCEHIRLSKSPIKYFVVDTFNSFTDDDVNYEVENRSKPKFDSDFLNFTYNDFNVWSTKFKEFSFLTAYKSDCSKFDYSKIDKLQLVFLDVDLYLPTFKALELIYDQLEYGGCIMVDNVSLSYSIYDGAYQAYNEFCNKYNIPVQYLGNNAGLIYKKLYK
jgi:hypothetical protein